MAWLLPSQARIRLEAEAVLLILARCESGSWAWVSSEVVRSEIARTPDPERRRRVQLVAAHSSTHVHVEASEVERACELVSWGFSAYDALHLACAERGGADVFLTTDDKLLNKATAHAQSLRVRVDNPFQDRICRLSMSLTSAHPDRRTAHRGCFVPTINPNFFLA